MSETITNPETRVIGTNRDFPTTVTPVHGDYVPQVRRPIEPAPPPRDPLAELVQAREAYIRGAAIHLAAAFAQVVTAPSTGCTVEQTIAIRSLLTAQSLADVMGFRLPRPATAPNPFASPDGGFGGGRL